MPYYGYHGTYSRTIYRYELIPEREWSMPLIHKKRWDKIAGLDARPFYSFLYPEEDKWFIHTEEAPGGITQFAPFTIYLNKPEEIKVIECDSIPIWFSWTDNIQNYSFPIEPDKEHIIKLRTTDTSITIRTDSGFFQPGMKTIFSINNDFRKHTQNTFKGDKHSWEISVIHNEFRRHEKEHYKKYISRIPVEPGSPYT
ncbi:MAG: hypothetical protein LIP01_05990, partial [Tannerellaceae bacterium]|nr:hypothetical protein [Tannerellaceae bacterium]